MKKFPINVLKPGIIFSEPVYIDETNLLVPAGVLIRQKDLDKLKAWGITTVQSNGSPQIDEAESSDKFADNKKLDMGAAIPFFSDFPENKSAYNNYMILIERMNNVFLKMTKGDIIDYQVTNVIATQLLQVFRSEPGRFIGFILGGDVKGFEMAKSSVNTAILSTLCATELKLPNHRILNIIIGALLHDIGMLRLPKEITEKNGGLSDQERRLIHSHPILSQRMVIKEFSYHDDVGNIVLNHHERWDGEGYPFRLSGEKIDLGARIVTIADAFEAMISQKSYRNSIVGNQAIKNLLSDNSRRFDSDILKVFVMTMGMYPIGSIILLNNGAVARISDVRALAPLRPKIQVLIDENKKTIKIEDVISLDLLEEKNLYIKKALDGAELLQLYK